ncbi:MAG: hypothetical protein GXY77_18000 [Fibrobacter sp.]|nr:hypothetical protein [Fibrobacter sp.]
MILLEPQILRYSNNKRAWELIGSMGSIDVELLLSSPPKKKNNYQVGGRITDNYLIRFKNHAWGNGNTPMSPFVSSDSARLNYSAPNMFGDVYMITNHDLKSFNLKTFTWYALDSYEDCWRENRIVNWGLFSAKLNSKKVNSRLNEIILGGSRQLFFEGKRYGLTTPLKEIKRDNIALSGKLNRWDIGKLELNTDFSIEAVKWDGFLSLYPDSSITDSNASRSEHLTANTNKILKTGSNDITGSTHISLSKTATKGSFGFDIVTGVAGAEYNTHIFADPSLWYTYRQNKTAFRANIGSMTFHPDIRGLPEKNYINRRLNLYSANNELELFLLNNRLNLYAETYIKYFPHYSGFSEKVGYIAWDTDCQSKLLSYGVCFSSELDCERFGLYTFQNFGRSTRYYQDKTVPYEWEIPWSNKTTLRYNVASGRLNFYFSGIFAGGVPYREIVLKNDGNLSYDNIYKRVKIYKRLDMKIETVNSVDHKFLTRFDAYLDIINVANVFEGLFKPSKWVWENEREYYWDGNLKKHPVEVEKASVAIGAKLGFKTF